MNELAVARFIYQPNVFLEYMLFFLIIVSFFKPRLLTALATGILLVRPNERMELSIPLVQILFVVLLAAIVMSAYKFKQLAELASSKYLKLFIALIAVQTVLFHPFDGASVAAYISLGLLLYCSVLLFMGDDIGFKWLSCAIIASCFLICFEPMYYHYTEPQGSELWNLFHLRKSGRLQAWGMWANANETAYLACLAIANLLILTAKHRTAKHYLACAVLIPFFSMVVFLTASRAGFASLLLIFLPSVMLQGRNTVKFAVVLAMLCAVLVSQAVKPVRTDAEGSSEHRGELRLKGKMMVAEYPLRGVGFGRAREEAAGIPLHNTYLQAFAETGIVGGCLLVTFLFMLGRNAYATWKSAVAKDDNRHFIFLLGMYCSSMFYFFWGNQLLSILFFLLIAQINNGINNALLGGHMVRQLDADPVEAAGA